MELRRGFDVKIIIGACSADSDLALNQEAVRRREGAVKAGADCRAAVDAELGRRVRRGAHRHKAVRRADRIGSMRRDELRNQTERGETRRAQGMSKRHEEPKQGYDQLTLQYRIFWRLGIAFRGRETR